MHYPATLPDTLLKLISDDGFSTGEAYLVTDGRFCAYVDASKNGHRWRVLAPTRYEAVTELMLQKGWDLEDG